MFFPLRTWEAHVAAMKELLAFVITPGVCREIADIMATSRESLKACRFPATHGLRMPASSPLPLPL